MNEWGWSLGGIRGVGWGFIFIEFGGLLYLNDFIIEWDYIGVRFGSFAFVFYYEEVKVMECLVLYIG